MMRLQDRAPATKPKLQTLDPDWLDEHAEELYAHLEEARLDVDRRYPRRGNQQADWLWRKRCQEPGFSERWVAAHMLMFHLRKELTT